MDLEKRVMEFGQDILMGTGMRVALVCMVITRIWALDHEERYSRKVKDMVQQLCRIEITD